ncbi:MAG: hypothetical protein GW893_04470 [Armatimonadetes bacterium]|nr:hypothetical protein [Armatimonadota bacterium]
MKGNLMILPSTGAASKPRVATAAEKQAWKQQSSMVSATSPDGKYRAEKVEGEGIGPSFQIVNASNGNVVLGSDVIENLSGQAMGETVFDGWFPDSRHFAAITHSHISSQENYTRCVINVASKRVVRFNGWLAPSLNTAIVPDKEDLAEDQITHDYPSNTYSSGDLRWFAVTMPPRPATYRFAQVPRKLLTLNGNPFSITGAVLDREGHSFTESVDHLSFVEFSPDGEWALCHGQAEHLVSMSSGQVQKLPGTQARFLSTAAESVAKAPVPSSAPKPVMMDSQLKRQLTTLMEDIGTCCEPILLQGEMPDTELIHFGIYQNALRHHDRLQGFNMNEGTYVRLSSEYVSQSVKQYFDKTITHQPFEDWEFRNGYYVGDAMSFEQLGPSEVRNLELMDLGDGLFALDADVNVGLWDEPIWLETRATLRKVVENKKGRFVVVEYVKR